MIELIPAIDLYNGRCVRLTKGDYDLRTTYDADPAAIAAEFERLGYRRLHMVDKPHRRLRRRHQDRRGY